MGNRFTGRRFPDFFDIDMGLAESSNFFSFIKIPPVGEDAWSEEDVLFDEPFPVFGHLMSGSSGRSSSNPLAFPFPCGWSPRKRQIQKPIRERT